MSWDQLLELSRVMAQEKELLDSEPPVACPNDGEPLSTGPDGILFCRFDGWTAC